jgi:hypothetical protein
LNLAQPSMENSDGLPGSVSMLDLRRAEAGYEPLAGFVQRAWHVPAAAVEYEGGAESQSAAYSRAGVCIDRAATVAGQFAEW